MKTPNRSEFSDHLGRPICVACGKGYYSLRICINQGGAKRKIKELCQSCRQLRRLAEKRGKP
jgi:hypothetical protein